MNFKYSYNKLKNVVSLVIFISKGFTFLAISSSVFIGSPLIPPPPPPPSYSPLRWSWGLWPPRKPDITFQKSFSKWFCSQRFEILIHVFLLNYLKIPFKPINIFLHQNQKSYCNNRKCHDKWAGTFSIWSRVQKDYVLGDGKSVLWSSIVQAPKLSQVRSMSRRKKVPWFKPTKRFLTWSHCKENSLI